MISNSAAYIANIYYINFGLKLATSAVIYIILYIFSFKKKNNNNNMDSGFYFNEM